MGRKDPPADKNQKHGEKMSRAPDAPRTHLGGRKSAHGGDDVVGGGGGSRGGGGGKTRSGASGHRDNKHGEHHHD